MISATLCMVSYNRLFYTQQAITELFLSAGAPFVLHVYDNASIDGSQEWIELFAHNNLNDNRTESKLILHKMDQNYGQGHCVNKFMDEEINTPYFGFVYNDCIVPSGYLPVFMDVLEKNPDIGILCSQNCGIVMDTEGNVVFDYPTRKYIEEICHVSKYVARIQELPTYLAGAIQKNGYYVLPSTMVSDICSLLPRIVADRGCRWRNAGRIFGTDFFIGDIRGVNGETYSTTFVGPNGQMACYYLKDYDDQHKNMFCLHIGAPENALCMVENSEQVTEPDLRTPYLEHARLIWRERKFPRLDCPF